MTAGVLWFMDAAAAGLTENERIAVIGVAGVVATSLAAIVVAVLQGRKTRTAHTGQHATGQGAISQLRTHIDGRFDHIETRLDDQSSRLTRIERVQP